jgi:hypothetical protein
MWTVAEMDEKSSFFPVLAKESSRIRETSQAQRELDSARRYSRRKQNFVRTLNKVFGSAQP